MPWTQTSAMDGMIVTPCPHTDPTSNLPSHCLTFCPAVMSPSSMRTVLSGVTTFQNIGGCFLIDAGADPSQNEDVVVRSQRHSVSVSRMSVWQRTQDSVMATYAFREPSVFSASALRISSFVANSNAFSCPM